jgi:hypothetical protein
MTVIITDKSAVPRIAPGDSLLGPSNAATVASTYWQPDRSPSGPVSIIVSAADRRVVVLRNGITIGSAVADLTVPIRRTTAYVLRQDRDAGRQWIRLTLPGQAASHPDPAKLSGHVRVEESFRTGVEQILQPGATVVVTADSLRAGSSGETVKLIEADP